MGKTRNEWEEPVAEEPVKAVEIEKKNGAQKKLNDDRNLVWWEGSTYVIDLDDNCVWSHDADNELVSCVGEWNPETKEVCLD